MTYWVLLDTPVAVPGVDGEVHGIELAAPEPARGHVASAAYLSADLAVAATVEVEAHQGFLLTSTRFWRGDANADGNLSVVDALLVLEYVFRGGALACRKAADGNDDGRINIVDPVHIVRFLFGGGAALPAPFFDCGVDPTADSLSRDTEPACS